MTDVKGKLALIRAGVSGIGFGIARAFALSGVSANGQLILTLPEFGGDFKTIHRKLMAVLSDEAAPPEPLKIEATRRAVAAAAVQGREIRPGDLT